ARAGAAGDQDVEAGAGGDLEDGGHRQGDVVLPRHDVEGDGLFGEFADRDGRAVDGERRRDDVDTAAVLEAGIDQRGRFVDAAADQGDDAGGDAHDVGVVAEDHIGELELAAAFDIDLLGAVHHDVGDGVVGQKRLERPQPQHVVEQHRHQMPLLRLIELD